MNQESLINSLKYKKGGKRQKKTVKNTPQNQMIEINSNISPSTCINTYKSQKQNVESKRQNTKMYLVCAAMM